MSNLIIYILSIAIAVFLSAGSYGTKDLQVINQWVQTYNSQGFWSGFASESTYPHILMLIIYKLSQISSSPLVIKNIFVLIFSLAGLLMAYAFPNNSLTKRFLTFGFILNPAILLHTSILGYLDSLYILSIIAALILFYLIESNPQYKNGKTFFLGVIIVIGPFTKWQSLVFIPVLLTMLAGLAYKHSVIKSAIYGLTAGVFLTLFPVWHGARSLYETYSRFASLLHSFHRITNEYFVVANFGNLWQLFNFFRTSYPDLTHHFKYWYDPLLQVRGRIVVMLVFLATGLVSYLKIKKLKNFSFFSLALSGCLWTNLIYVIFATGVHENHFMPSIALSTLFYLFRSSSGNLVNLFNVSLVNFVNLFYFYGFGETGLWGLIIATPDFPINLSVLLSVFILCLFLFKIGKLIKTNYHA